MIYFFIIKGEEQIDNKKRYKIKINYIYIIDADNEMLMLQLNSLIAAGMKDLKSFFLLNHTSSLYTTKPSS